MTARTGSTSQHVDVREDIVNACQRLAGIGKNVLDPPPYSGISGIDHWHPKLGGRNDFRVLDNDAFLSVIDSTGQQDDAGAILLEIFQVELVHCPDGGHSDDGPGAQSRFAGSPGRHGPSEAMDAHTKSTGRRGVHEDLPGGRR